MKLGNQSTLRIKPIIKWTGGKSAELDIIAPVIPNQIKRYFEPFIGGGAVWLNSNAESFVINDKSDDLVAFYAAVKRKDKAFIETIKLFDKAWDDADWFVSLSNGKSVFGSAKNGKLSKHAYDLLATPSWQSLPVSMAPLLLKSLIEKNRQYEKFLESENVFGNLSSALMETAAKASIYLCIRQAWNEVRHEKAGSGQRAALYWLLRSYCYAGMFRFNAAGAFNVPYGGQSYNKRSPVSKLDEIGDKDLRDKLKVTSIYQGDFEAFLKKEAPAKGDFIFLDPPYDSTFSAYEGASFDRTDQKRLADFLIDTPANWLMVIGQTPFIKDLYNRKGLYVSSFKKRYQVNFKNRHDPKSTHLMISNYKID